MARIIASLIRILFGVIIALPLLLYPWLYFNQERLLFPTIDLEIDHYQQLQQQQPKGEIHLPVTNAVTLHGWFANYSTEKKAPLIIYFGGNAEDATTNILDDKLYQHWAILAVNYRGYGYSQGQASEQALYADALAVYDYARSRQDINPNKIMVMGRSLGSGIAVYLAAHRAILHVLLITPYDSIQQVAQGIYPYVPIKWLLKHPFNAISYVPSIHIPATVWLASDDQSIPYRNSRKLIAAWGGEIQTHTIANSGHNDLIHAPVYRHSLQNLLMNLN